MKATQILTTDQVIICISVKVNKFYGKSMIKTSMSSAFVMTMEECIFKVLF